MLLIGFGYREIAIGYLTTDRDLELNSRSPIFSYFSELLEGIVTVRAFSAEQRFLHSSHRKIDTTTKIWYTFWMTNRWLLFNFNLLGALSALITTLFAIATLTNEASLDGLCITSAMAFTSSVYWAYRFWTGMIKYNLTIDIVVANYFYSTRIGSQVRIHVYSLSRH